MRAIALPLPAREEAPALLARLGVADEDVDEILDPQLREYLAPESDIVRFQRRCTLVAKAKEGDADVFRYVFGLSRVAVDEAPQRTTLERAIIAHLRAGRNWSNRYGWLEIDGR